MCSMLNDQIETFRGAGTDAQTTAGTKQENNNRPFKGKYNYFYIYGNKTNSWLHVQEQDL